MNAEEQERYRKLFLFAAKAGALEGYLFGRGEVETLDDWVDNIVHMYRDLPPEMKKVVDPVLVPVLAKTLEYGKETMNTEFKSRLEQILQEAAG